MRVLFVLNTFYPGYMAGAEISAYHTARQLRREGVDCRLLVVSNRMFPQTQDVSFLYDGLPVHLVSFAGGKRSRFGDIFDHRIFRVVRAEARQIRPDLAHVHNLSGATMAPFLALQRESVPMVSTLHDLWLLCANNMRFQSDGALCDVSKYRERCNACFRRYDYWGDIPARRTVFAMLSRPVRRFISPSEALIDQHVRAGYDRRRFRMVPYGLTEPSAREPSHPAVREIVESAGRYRTAAFAGGGVVIKGARTLAGAVPVMMRQIERLRVVVAGGGEPDVLSHLSSLPGVHVLGPVPPADMRALYASADISISPSIWFENSPVVIYENFQVGTPVAGSAIGGIPELIEDGRTGYLFPAGDSDELAARVVWHFARPAIERRRMRRACFETARSRLSMEQHMQGIRAVYDEALSA